MPNLIRGVYGITHGCDPEVFLSVETGKLRKRRAVLCSDVLIPKGGLKAGANGSVVRDGVQVELHPTANLCRASHSFYLKECFATLRAAVAKKRLTQGFETLQVDFRPVVRLTPTDLLKMDPDARRLGCLPSKNAYGRKHIEKDGNKYPIRSASGHIHMGTTLLNNTVHNVNPDRLAQVLDVLLGNTCVLIDRDPLAAVRRKVYGRAGEYRTPPHGFEYRTLSNFWLRDYKLFSFVMAMSKLAGYVVQGEVVKHYYKDETIWDAEQALMKDVDLSLIEQAINTNDLVLAQSNYERWVRPFLADITFGIGVDSTNIHAFDHFLARMREHEAAGKDGLSYWFPQTDIVDHWAFKPDGHGTGWESFMAGAVQQDMARVPQVTGVVTTPIVAPNAYGRTFPLPEGEPRPGIWNGVAGNARIGARIV